MLPSACKAPFSLSYKSIVIVLVCFLTGAGLHAQAKAATLEKPLIRAVTAFVNLDRAQYKQQVADAMTMLKRARTIFESRGYKVMTLRIATQPFPEYTKGLTTDQ